MLTETLTLPQFQAAPAGAHFLTGFTGTNQIHIVPARWVAFKHLNGKSWCVKFHETKHTPAFIAVNGFVCRDKTVVADIISCSEDLMALYKQ